MKRKVLFDSNIPILLSKDIIDKKAFAAAFKTDKWAMSIVSKIEVLSKPDIPADAARFIDAFLARCKIVPLSGKIAAETIQLRRASRLKLPDAVIAASAAALGATLVSNDTRLSKTAYPGLSIKSV